MPRRTESEWDKSPDRAELTELVENMLDGRNHITYDDLISVLPELEKNIDLLEMLLGELARRGVADPDETKVDKPEEDTSSDETADSHYAAPDDLLSIYLAEMYVESINIAWCAVPLFWFSQMDGRGPWDLEGSICEHQRVMAWYGERGIPVELNEPHHWGLRDAPDAISVVSAYLAAYNARAFGVQDYIAQMMFNTPPGVSDKMDLAKMLAILDLIAPLAGPEFHIWRQTRTGLLNYPLDPDAARAHLAVTIYVQMALRPHIVHVVSQTEAHHAATADDVIEACKLARVAIENAVRSQPDMTADSDIQERKEELAQEAQIALDAVRSLAGARVPDPLTDPSTLTRAVTMGLLDAPHLCNNPFGRGQVVTRIDERGACVAVDPANGRKLSERERIATLSIRRRRNLDTD